MRQFRIKQLKVQINNVKKGLVKRYSVYLHNLYCEIEKEIEIQRCYMQHED